MIFSLDFHSAFKWVQMELFKKNKTQMDFRLFKIRQPNPLDICYLKFPPELV